MNFVHFPKLHDYALDPELVKEPAQFGRESSGVSKQADKHVTFPDITQTRRVSVAQQPSPWKQSARDRLLDDQPTQVKPASSANPVVISAPAGTSRDRRSRDVKEQRHNVDASERIQFFQRWSQLPLPVEGLDFSLTSHNDSGTVGPADATRISVVPEGTNPQTDHVGLTSDITPTPDPTPRDRVGDTTDENKNTKKQRSKGQNSSEVRASLLSKSPIKQSTNKQNAILKGKYLHRFKRMALAVVNVLKLAKAIIKRTDSPSALLKTFTAMSREPETDDQSENMKSYGLHFDPSYFRTNKEISISSEVKAILRLPPSHRSPEQIQTAMFGLQSLPSFAEYPLHMQEKLTKVAWHEIVTPMRTIIRQGHFAENFYFILAGQAVVTIAKPGSTQTAAIMRRGTSFGELALLHHSRRTATVTSHDTVQLLSVGREDFFDIFMSGQGRGGVPEHIKFISQMDFMKDWPLERLLERPDQCLLHFFKRNMVIVKDSKISDWFYVVKSGSCQVLKQLKAVHGNLRPAGVQRSTYRTMSDRLGVGVWNRGLKKLHPGRAISWAMSSKAFHKKMNIASNLEHGLTTRTDSSSELTQQGDGPASGQSTGQQQQHQHHHQEQRPQQPVFVQIELLKPKDVFGLDLLNSNLDLNPPSVSLVSRGAECIMLSKAFFLRYANDQTRKRFSESIQPYPDEETMQESLQTKVNWQLYKHSLITEIIGQRHTVLTKQRLTSGL